MTTSAGVMLAILMAQPQKPGLEALLARATTYVDRFVANFANVVAEERYVQESTIPPRTAGQGVTKTPGPAIVGRRAMRSDFLLVRRAKADSFETFRDVWEVDGHEVPGGRDRLTALLSEPSQDALDLAWRIARESARFNLVPTRTLNTPLVALAFLQPRYQSRFRFSLAGADAEAGPDVWILEYRERARPTILRTNDDRDLAASGRIWVERATGRVVKTELVVSPDDRIVTTFQFDDRFEIAVPIEMRETYSSGPAYYLGVATYGRFRRFGVSTDETIAGPVAR
jgi:hypothetical protein